jgi:hypothetical protein
VAIVIPAEGTILERVLQTAHSIEPEGLTRKAYATFDAAQTKTAWGRRHQRRFALMDGADVLASAAQYDLAAVLDQRLVRVCGIGSVFSEPAHHDGGHARELVDRSARRRCARRSGDGACLFRHQSRTQPAGLEVIAMTEAELFATDSARQRAVAARCS